MGHTPEPWYAEMNSAYWEFGWFNDGNFVQIGDTCASSASAPHYGQSLALGEANARRIVACVNACTGMADPAGEIQRLRAERDRYEKALKEIAKGEGAFSRDPLKHAENVINNSITIAETALSAKEAE